MSVRARAVVAISDDFVEAVTERVVARIGPVHVTPWMGVEQAALHLACSKHRLYRLVSMRRVPHHHEGARLLFDRTELDAWVRGGGRV
jgi:excisionase family DNA binding protein